MTTTDRPGPAPESPATGRQGWQTSLAPQFIGAFLWVAFFDQIPREAVGRGALVWPVAGAAVAGVLSYLLLYRAPATWGMRTGRPLAALAEGTFGARGAAWVPGLVLAATHVIWLAVSASYATALTLRGLVLVRLLDPSYLQPRPLAGVTVPGFLVIVTSLAWALAAAFTGRYLVRVIAALMNVYPVLEACLLGASALVAFRWLPGYRPATAVSGASNLTTLLVTVQMVFGFTAAVGLASADWGTVARDQRDVRLGGLVGVVMAPWVVVTLAVLIVAGALGQSVGPGGLPPAATGGLTFAQAVEPLMGGRLAGAVLMAFGLAALAPACYAAFSFGNSLHDLAPRVSRSKWTAVVALLAWLLVLSGAVARLFPVFSVVGGLLAPVAGAITADYLRSRGVWPGPRRGVNRPGMIAWGLGAFVGLLPVVPGLAGWQPAAVYAYLVAFAAYYATAVLGMEENLSADDADGHR